MAATHGLFGQFQFSLVIIFLLLATNVSATRTRKNKMNTIDRCWRSNPMWHRNREQLAMCSVGFAGKMSNNIGRNVRRYTVTDPSDDPLKPGFGTLRYGATMIKGKVWIDFKRDMQIKLNKPLLVSSFTTIDGRGAEIHIAYGGCFLLYEVTNVIIHGLQIHHCEVQQPGPVMGPGSKIVDMGMVDGDAIRLVTSSKIWIDHNTLYECHDGLLDVTRGSTDVTISNNLFRNHDKVMLLGHDDSFLQDKKMKVTLVFNRFGPNCNQRMPRVRHGYAHVVNNLYQGWLQYAIGGSMNPIIKSESNLYIAPKSGSKAVTWREGGDGIGRSWTWRSVKDAFIGGSYFSQTGYGRAIPAYNRQQWFRVEDAKDVMSLTRSSGALRCSIRSRC